MGSTPPRSPPVRRRVVSDDVPSNCPACRSRLTSHIRRSHSSSAGVRRPSLVESPASCMAPALTLRTPAHRPLPPGGRPSLAPRRPPRKVGPVLSHRVHTPPIQTASAKRNSDPTKACKRASSFPPFRRARRVRVSASVLDASATRQSVGSRLPGPQANAVPPRDDIAVVAIQRLRNQPLRRAAEQDAAADQDAGGPTCA